MVESMGSYFRGTSVQCSLTFWRLGSLWLEIVQGSLWLEVGMGREHGQFRGTSVRCSLTFWRQGSIWLKCGMVESMDSYIGGTSVYCSLTFWWQGSLAEMRDAREHGQLLQRISVHCSLTFWRQGSLCLEVGMGREHGQENLSTLLVKSLRQVSLAKVGL